MYRVEEYYEYARCADVQQRSSAKKVAIYVAGSSHEIARVRFFTACLTRTDLFSFQGAWWEGCDWAGRDAELPIEEQRRRSSACLEAIERSDIFVLLFPRFGQRSSAEAEFGYALSVARRRPLHIVCTGSRASSGLLTSLAHYRDADDCFAIVEACRHARSLRAASCSV
jgi:hypothetical protein